VPDEPPDGGGGIHIAPFAPQAELGDVHTALAGFALGDPWLGSTDRLRKVAGGHACLLAHGAEQSRDPLVLGQVQSITSHMATIYGMALDTIVVSNYTAIAGLSRTRFVFTRINVDGLTTPGNP
jgi:hypothetical protein